jgi:3',5'-nucleoside bisphosphate phosphatase
MLREMRMDLHVHTCLSPCGGSANVPTRIVETACLRQLDVIGICDHNSAENVAAVRAAAENTRLRVFGGMEVSTKEEVHLLLYFEHEHDLLEMQKTVYTHLEGENNSDAFGDQYIVDEEDYVTGINPRLLIGATTLSIDQMIAEARKFPGLVIASHIDRGAFSLVSQLGFVPENLALDAVEFSPHYDINNTEASTGGYPWVTFSDAHSLEDIGKVFTTFNISEPSISEVKKALQDCGGRRIIH